MEEEQAPALPRGGRSLWHDVVYGRQITGKPTGYARRVCGHRSMIGRLALDGKFMGHGGCVNTVAFSREGDLAVTGRCVLAAVAAHLHVMNRTRSMYPVRASDLTGPAAAYPST